MRRKIDELDLIQCAYILYTRTVAIGGELWDSRVQHKTT